MKYTKIEKQNCCIHLIKIKKFKKNVINISFRQPIKNNIDTIKKDILCNLLILGSNKYKTRRELEIKCEDLFGASINLNNKKAGSYNIFSLTASFLDDKYTLEETRSQTIEFIKEVLFNPLIINNKFDQNLVSIAKRGYLEDIKSIPDNPTQFSIIKMRELIDSDSLYAFSPYFYIDQINDISNQDLLDTYNDILNNSDVDISIIGDVDDDIISLFDNLPIKQIKYNNSSYSLVKNNYIQKVDSGKYSQSKLVMAYNLKDLTEIEKTYTAYIFSFILGGSSDSLIFKKLRQENSLCYYADSSYLLFYQMLEINVGLESKNYDKAVSLTKEVIDEISNGNIREEDIIKAKKTYENAWKEIMDNQLSIINMYLSHEYYNLDYINERIKIINKITKEDIIKLSKKIQLSAIYLLKGTNENEEDTSK